jgi:hypothetical protein
MKMTMKQRALASPGECRAFCWTNAREFPS